MWAIGRRRDWEDELGDECEAFLTGDYATYLAARNRPVPVWVCLNVLAHGDHDAVTAVAAGAPRGDASPHTAAWQRALAYLAQEVLSETTRRGCSLGDLQRSTLVPLELELAGRDTRFLGPTQLVSTVLTVLAEHPTSRQS